MSVAKIALRNLSRQRRRTYLLGGAIAFGVLIVTLVNGVTGGLVVNIEANVSKMLAGHIIVSSLSKDENKRTYLSMEASPALDRAVKAIPQKVAYTQRRTQAAATLIFESVSIGRTVEGVDWKNDRFLVKDLTLVAGTLADLDRPMSILVSKKQAAKLGVRLGEPLFVQTATVHGQQNFDTFTVRAVYDDSGSSVSSSAFIALEEANRLLDMKAGSFNIFGITLENFSDTDQATLAFLAALGKDLPLKTRAETAGKTFQDLYAAFKKDKTAFGPQTVVTSINDELAGIKGQIMAVNGLALLVLVLLLLVIMVGLTNTYRIIVFERSREIGTMRAMGMQRKKVQQIFVLEAVFLSLGGVVLGVALAVVLLAGLSLISFGTDGDTALNFVLSNGHLAWRLDLVTLVLTTGLVAGLTWLAALVPARRAGKVDPAVALRTTA